MTKKGFWGSLAAALLLLPRIPAAYAAYAIGSMLLYSLSYRAILNSLINYLFFLGAFYSLWMLGYLVSPTSFLIQAIMCLPFIYFVSSGRFSGVKVNGITLMRAINLSVFVLSFLN